MKSLKISVVMPVYNCQKFLSLSIESILNQTFREFEFIIVDDGSTDKSWEIIKKYSLKDKRIVAIKCPKNLKISAVLNKGLAKSRGKYIIRMDADDWSYPYRLKKQYEYMEKHKKVGVSGGTIEVCNEKLKVINKRNYPLTDGKARRVIFGYSPFAHPATIWRADIIKKVGGYNENIPYSQDAELYFKVGQIAEFGNIADTLIKLRMHKNSTSFSKDRQQELYAIYARIKASLEYKYKTGIIDKLYIFFRIVIMIVVPPPIKFKIFNFIRRVR